MRYAKLIALVLAVPLGGPLAAQPKKPGQTTPEAKLRKAQEALKKTDASLNWLSKSLYLGAVVTKSPDLKELSRFAAAVRKPISELKKSSDKVIELGNKQHGKEAEKEAKTLLDKVKLVKIKNQASELEHLAKKVRDMPVGLVSEKVDDKFVVSADILVKDPKEAEKRFKAYLAAMKMNADYLKAKHEQLDDVAKVAGAASKLFRQVQTDIEKVIPFSGPYAKTLTEVYLDADKLAKAYNELSSDCATKSKAAKAAEEVERKRFNDLRATVKTFFGFDT